MVRNLLRVGGVYGEDRRRSIHQIPGLHIMPKAVGIPRNYYERRSILVYYLRTLPQSIGKPTQEPIPIQLPTVRITEVETKNIEHKINIKVSSITEGEDYNDI